MSSNNYSGFSTTNPRRMHASERALWQAAGSAMRSKIIKDKIHSHSSSLQSARNAKVCRDIVSKRKPGSR